MATGKLLPTTTDTSTTAFNSLASATYAATAAIDISSIDPVDLTIQVALTPGTVSSDKGAYVFVKTSFDGTNYSTGPESGTTTTDEAALNPIGFLPLTTNSTLQRKAFNVRHALGYIPPYFKVVIKNASGAALASSGHKVEYTTYLVDIA